MSQYNKLTIGVLSLQGGFSLHLHHLKKLGCKTIVVKKKEDFSHCDGLILPGGESTTMLKHLSLSGMHEALLRFEKPMFGTCAGLILMAKEGFLPISLERNAYGRQSASFSTKLNVSFPQENVVLEGRFIRAPRITYVNESVKVLAQTSEPVMVQYGFHLGCTFHPELTDNPCIHQYFISLVDSSL